MTLKSPHHSNNIYDTNVPNLKSKPDIEISEAVMHSIDSHYTNNRLYPNVKRNQNIENPFRSAPFNENEN